MAMDCDCNTALSREEALEVAMSPALGDAVQLYVNAQRQRAKSAALDVNIDARPPSSLLGAKRQEAPQIESAWEQTEALPPVAPPLPSHEESEQANLEVCGDTAEAMVSTESELGDAVQLYMHAQRQRAKSAALAVNIDARPPASLLGAKRQEAPQIESAWKKAEALPPVAPLQPSHEESGQTDLEACGVTVEATVSKEAVAISTDAKIASEASRATIASCGMQPVLRTIYSEWNLVEQQVGLLNDGVLKELQIAAFEDKRWDNALHHLEVSGAWENPQDVQELLRSGAKVFGFWHLPDAVLEDLTGHLRRCPSQPTPALSERLQSASIICSTTVPVAPPTGSRLSCKGSVYTQGSVGQARDPATVESSGEARMAKVIVLGIVFVLSNLYALEVCTIMYPGIIQIFGLPIYFARAGGFGTLIWTALLFLSMCRTFHKMLARFLPFTCWLYEIIYQHKELHIFCGQMLFATAALHVLSHCVGTVPGLISHPVEEVNAILGCANPDTTKFYMGVYMAWLQLVPCPLEKTPTYMGVLFGTTPGLTGVALVLLSAAIGYTARAVRRKTHFEWFIYVHNAAMPLWLVLLFIHGSAGWVGVGFPLVVVVCTLPVALYLMDRIGRLLRYYLFTGTSVRIVDVVIRPGAGHNAPGSLINLKLSKPPYLWCFRGGMYGFLCMPEYSKFQFHPFTICSGKDDDTVDFIINSCGDWTCALAEKCLAAHKGEGELPLMALDGPYLAPTATALNHQILVAVGAGVGITPFLSLMSTIIAVLGDEMTRKTLPLEEAHFFWMTRSADELLFGRRYFTRIVSDPLLREKVYLHLHVTHPETDQDIGAFLFREAVRRQSCVDKAAYRDAVVAMPDLAKVGRGMELPCCWAHGAQGDVLWVDSLIDAPDVAGAQVAAAHEDHWASGLPAQQDRHQSFHSSTGSAGGTSLRRGLFAPSRSDITTMQTMLTRDSASNFSVPTMAAPTGTAGFSNFLPVVFGRPNFAKEIRGIGQAHSDQDVHVYVCGNDGLVAGLKETCLRCSEEAKASKEDDLGNDRNAQEFIFHYERFG